MHSDLCSLRDAARAAGFSFRAAAVKNSSLCSNLTASNVASHSRDFSSILTKSHQKDPSTKSHTHILTHLVFCRVSTALSGEDAPSACKRAVSSCRTRRFWLWWCAVVLPSRFQRTFSIFPSTGSATLGGILNINYESADWGSVFMEGRNSPVSSSSH